MITRLVKMTFYPENLATFLQLFSEKKSHIRSSPGCLSLQLLLHQENDGIVFTFSTWENEDFLEEYRKSALFKETWRKTKKLFSDRPEAWTTTEFRSDK